MKKTIRGGRILAISAIGILASNCYTTKEARADWWSDHNPLRQVTPNWGPLIPHPRTGPELAPPCWGNPQNCRDPNTGGSLPSQYPAPPNASYSVTHRYICSDNSTCDISTSGSSCQEAASNQNNAVQEDGGDPCQHCGVNAVYTPYRNLIRTESITGGACQGW
jgi:hypothetical protein